jgi:hypothetical protein
MPPKRTRRDGSGQQHSAVAVGKALRTSLNDAFNAGVEEVFEAIEQEDQRNKEESARLLAQAQTAAAKVKRDTVIEVEEMKTDAAKEVDEMRRKVQEERAALEEDKAAMEKTHSFQKNKILLNVGGHRFETSLQTLTSVPATYFASLFSGRYELDLDAEGTYSIDRDGSHFRHILNFLRDAGSFELSSDMTEGQRRELVVELQFYGLIDHMIPYYAQEQEGQALLRRACLAGTKQGLQTAVAQARELVFEIGSTTPFLTEEFQDLRFVITDRTVNGSPVWAASSEVSELFMYHARNGATGNMVIGDALCRESGSLGFIRNWNRTGNTGAAPTNLPLDEWVSRASATLPLKFADADRTCSDGYSPGGAMSWAFVPNMCINVVHGLRDGDPTMVAAVRQLIMLA